MNQKAEMVAELHVGLKTALSFNGLKYSNGKR